MIEWVTALASALLIISAALAIVFKRYLSALKALRATNQTTWHDMQILGEDAFKRQQQLLIEENTRQRSLLQNFSDEALKKLMHEVDEKWACEKKYAALEQRYINLERDYVALENRVKQLEGKDNASGSTS